MKKILSLIVVGVLSLNTYAQQDPMLSHYMFNGLFLNPAYAGTHPYAGATLIHRQQWLGFGNGRPTTSVFGIDGPIKSETMGLGLTFVNDNTGGFHRNDIMLNYAYHIKVSDDAKLSLGINGGMVNLGYNNSKTFAWDDVNSDVALSNKAFWAPKFGAGAYYYTRKFYAGFSIPTLYAKEPSNLSLNDSKQFNFFKPHYTLTAGYLFDIGSNIMLKPSFLLKYQKAAPMQFDLNCNAFFGEAFSAGLSYRLDKTGAWLVALISYNVTPELRLGMSYDYTFANIRKYNSGSLEFMLGYDFGSKTMKVKNPRYF